jgi:hypothetical protein
MFLEDQIVEQANHYNYLRCGISFDSDDKSNKIEEHRRMYGTIKRALNTNATKENQLKLYKVSAVSIFII